jgi:hypothetical protein
MSLQFIYHFQAKLYELLSQNHEIRDSVSGIYLSIKQDAKYPFILINILKSNDISKHGVAIYEVDFEICIFAREKAQEFLLKTANTITASLKPERFAPIDYRVLSMKNTGLEFSRGHDLLTNKAVISYKALLQQRS